MATVVARWSAEWLPTSARCQSSADPLAQPEGRTWTIVGDVVAIGCSSEARGRLGRRLLAAPPSAPIASAADRRVVDAVADAAMADLAERLAAEANAAHAVVVSGERPDWSEASSRSVALDDVTTVAVLVGADAAVALARGVTTEVASPSLTRLSAALASQMVGVGAHLGGCTLTLAELSALEPGDVVVLERSAAVPVDLVIGRSPRSLARCDLRSESERLSLHLLEPINR